MERDCGARVVERYLSVEEDATTAMTIDDSDKPEDSCKFKHVPLEADFLLAYSTAPGAYNFNPH